MDTAKDKTVPAGPQCGGGELRGGGPAGGGTEAPGGGRLVQAQAEAPGLGSALPTLPLSLTWPGHRDARHASLPVSVHPDVAEVKMILTPEDGGSQPPALAPARPSATPRALVFDRKRGSPSLGPVSVGIQWGGPPFMLTSGV